MRGGHPLPVNQRVAGSSPADGAIFSRGYAGIAAALVSQIGRCLTALVETAYAVLGGVGVVMSMALLSMLVDAARRFL